MSTLEEIESELNRSFHVLDDPNALDEDNALYIGDEGSRDVWLKFLLILANVEGKKHLTSEGLDEILKLKGVL